MKIEKLEDIKCTRILVDNDEYLRIGGVWFLYTKDQYLPVDKPNLEKYYKEYFEK